MSRDRKNKLKLLIVDDETYNLDLLYRTFRREFRVYKAESAIAALQVLDEEGEMGVIISDQRMPEMNGTEFLSKTVERFPDTIRILLTGYTDVEDLVEAINSGQVFKYITKPWNPEELKSIVQQAAETYQVLKQRTNTLRRALRRESVFNQVMSAIRESLDYSSMLQTIVETLGQNFQVNRCSLHPVEGDRLMNSHFTYDATDPPTTSTETTEPENSENSNDGESSHPATDPATMGETEAGNTSTATAVSPDNPFIQKVLETRQTQQGVAENGGENSTYLVVPLTYQQQLLAVLSLEQSHERSSWEDEDVQFIESVADQAALAIYQAKLYQQTQEQAQQMRSELEVARQIQNNLLRQSWPDFEDVQVQACCYPAREVGGDFFEVYVHAQEDIWVAVGDVSGKGVPAALFMASAISVMRRELSQETSPDPETVMRSLNVGLADYLISNNCFITMVLARYRPSTGELAYANAGHIYPLVWSHQTLLQQHEQQESIAVEPQYLKARGIPLGILPEWKGKGGSQQLHSGDVFLLTSDGLTEATITSDGHSHPSEEGKMLQQSGLWELLIESPKALNLEELLPKVRDRTAYQEDDQTILSLEIL
ncbi:SpoIIE family protein phosphatase [Geitlerinema sp. PCC 9228]|uniref:SpoIIE family protein phosphatase n=1 Tax=Geitlerinema sp. PCC 9228 TaxID=111611 RepID=UPI0008F9876F|nr:SpoIIE family protein phosphatase [Geitlerinema sp. PCC 9228]